MTVLEVATAYVGAGLSVIPVKADGSKRPPVAWKKYQSELATPDDLRLWFQLNNWGPAVLGGVVSGGLEILDFETRSAFDRWLELVEADFPGLVARLPLVSTPGGGAHLYYRVRAPRGNTKLALDAAGETLIETRGEGGYVLAPGCPAACHPSGGTYRRVAGPPLTEVPYLDEVTS